MAALAITLSLSLSLFSLASTVNIFINYTPQIIAVCSQGPAMPDLRFKRNKTPAKWKFICIERPRNDPSSELAKLR